MGWALFSVVGSVVTIVADPPAPGEGFASWVEQPVVRVSLTKRHNQWYVTADDFGIAGMGRTEGEAYRDVAGLLDAYLRSCFAEGRTYADAVRARKASSRPPSDLIGLGEYLLRLGARYLLGHQRMLVLPSAMRTPGSVF